MFTPSTPSQDDLLGHSERAGEDAEDRHIPNTVWTDGDTVMASLLSHNHARKLVVTTGIAFAAAVLLPTAASAQPQNMVTEVDPRTGQYTIRVSPQREGLYEVVIATGTAGRITGVPDECGRESVLEEQVLDVPDAAALPQALPVTRTVLRCTLGQIDNGEVRRVPVTVVEHLEAGTDDMSATLYDLDGHEYERREWAMIPATICAPTSGAATLDEHDVIDTTTEGPARVVIAGTAPAHTQLILIGVDSCHRYINRSLITTNEGTFRFTGLLPGRYAVLDDQSFVLQYLEVTADAPLVDDLDLIDPVLGPVYGRGAAPTGFPYHQ
ncbi:hypothetical protein [Rhodococcus pyridinivorans]|uniref:hypothetical protein n=1 Tax=Rhodococcus pyridinivorans TaxID=103816 RepID=UPI00207883AB|nr:hypothetical protein [Rhodococcus pyridinivorans]USI88408.1 hypothetical protein LLA01_12225 [Rhodococcus pyridinivorans]